MWNPSSSYSLRFVTSDGRHYETASSNSRDQIEKYRQGVEAFLERHVGKDPRA
jgi:hypothetical protein